MRRKIMMMCVAALLAFGTLSVRAQQEGTAQMAPAAELRVGLDAQPVALDSLGRPALAAQLLTTALQGTPDVPVKNARFVVENRSPFFYSYVTGSATFYDGQGVRCGEGQFTLSALAPGERAETDAPGLRLTCSPAAWRLVANNLLTRTSERALPVEPAAETIRPEPLSTPAALPLEVVVDGQVYNAPLGSTLEIPVRKRRVRITVRQAQ